MLIESVFYDDQVASLLVYRLKLVYSVFSFRSLSSGSLSQRLSSCVNQHANTILCLESYFDIIFGQ